MVLKRTGYPHSSGNAIAAWLKALATRGADVVTPDPLFASNPRRVEDEWPSEWVVYPFVEGAGYTGRGRRLERPATSWPASTL